MKNHIRVDIMISYFLFFIVLFILFFMIVYAIYIFRKLRNKKDDCDKENEINPIDEEIKIKDENKIRYLLATIVILFSILYIIFTLIYSHLSLIGVIILAELIVFNCIKRYTHLERFYLNTKIFLILIIICIIFL